MIAFWILTALMVAVAVAALLPALLRASRPPADNTGDEAVIGVFRERLAELEHEHERGNLSDDDFT